MQAREILEQATYKKNWFQDQKFYGKDIKVPAEYAQKDFTLESPEDSQLKLSTLFQRVLAGEMCHESDPRRPYLSVYVHGPARTGKTHLVAAYARNVFVRMLEVDAQRAEAMLSQIEEELLPLLADYKAREAKLDKTLKKAAAERKRLEALVGNKRSIDAYLRQAVEEKYDSTLARLREEFAGDKNAQRVIEQVEKGLFSQATKEVRKAAERARQKHIDLSSLYNKNSVEHQKRRLWSEAEYKEGEFIKKHRERLFREFPGGTENFAWFDCMQFMEIYSPSPDEFTKRRFLVVDGIDRLTDRCRAELLSRLAQRSADQATIVTGRYPMDELIANTYKNKERIAELQSQLRELFHYMPSTEGADDIGMIRGRRRTAEIEQLLRQ